MKLDRLGWYWRRLRAMSADEVRSRARDEITKLTWMRRQVRPGQRPPPLVGVRRRSFPVALPPDTASAVPEDARRALLHAANRLLTGRAEVLGAARTDLVAPDWFLDPITGRRAPHDRYAFRIDHRSGETGNVKQLWELSRHQHLTVLAAAWFLTHDDRYAERVAAQLQSWWTSNPFLSGVHWTSGIELGVRLIAWSWIRRLLDRWNGVAGLFDENEVAAQQLYWHQRYLSRFRSIGSSANNHIVAEAAGQLVASCAFPWFRESERWRADAAALLERALEWNTFPTGVNRELASGYHAFVAELGIVAAVEAEAAGHPVTDATWRLLCGMVDVAAALVDERLRAPRQGDGDEGRALVVDDPDADAWPALLACGAGMFGALPWWPPRIPPDVRSVLLPALAPGRIVDPRPARRPSHFHDAGITLLRTAGGERPEIWCRCDGGPHGFLSIAAHAHADALSIEVRHGGVDVLADPGTYCYHGELPWRSYFRSTLAHNTLELDGRDQSRSGGPFLWLTHARTRQLEVVLDGDDGIQSWSAEHDGYCRLAPPAVHRRTVQLDPRRGRLTIWDEVVTDGRHGCRLAFHLGPSVEAVVKRSTAELTWSSDSGLARATLSLPSGLTWASHRGNTSPIIGWYSPSFGWKEPSITLLGAGSVDAHDGRLVTVLQLARPGSSVPSHRAERSQ